MAKPGFGLQNAVERAFQLSNINDSGMITRSELLAAFYRISAKKTSTEETRMSVSTESTLSRYSPVSIKGNNKNGTFQIKQQKRGRSRGNSKSSEGSVLQESSLRVIRPLSAVALLTARTFLGALALVDTKILDLLEIPDLEAPWKCHPGIMSK